MPSGQLLISARMAAFSTTSRQPATRSPSGELATRLTIPPALAESLLDHLERRHPPPVTAVNGTVMNGSRP